MGVGWRDLNTIHIRKYKSKDQRNHTHLLPGDIVKFQLLFTGILLMFSIDWFNILSNRILVTFITQF